VNLVSLLIQSFLPPSQSQQECGPLGPAIDANRSATDSAIPVSELKVTYRGNIPVAVPDTESA
jgi:hypothetical protein